MKKTLALLLVASLLLAGCTELISSDDDEVKKYLVYESMESEAINNWWSDDRLGLLENAAFSNVDSSFLSSLKMGKKMFWIWSIRIFTRVFRSITGCYQ